MRGGRRRSPRSSNATSMFIVFLLSHAMTRHIPPGVDIVTMCFLENALPLDLAFYGSPPVHSSTFLYIVDIVVFSHDHFLLRLRDMSKGLCSRGERERDSYMYFYFVPSVADCSAPLSKLFRKLSELGTHQIILFYLYITCYLKYFNAGCVQDAPECFPAENKPKWSCLDCNIDDDDAWCVHAWVRLCVGVGRVAGICLLMLLFHYLAVKFVILCLGH